VSDAGEPAARDARPGPTRDGTGLASAGTGSADLLPPAASGAGRRPRRRSDLAIVALAVLFALVPAAAYVERLARGTPPTTVPYLFPADARARFEALRDQAARGLLSLQQPGGGFPPRMDTVDIDPLDRAEATAGGFAGLAAAWRLGSRVPGLEDGMGRARRTLTQLQSQSGSA